MVNGFPLLSLDWFYLQNETLQHAIANRSNVLESCLEVLYRKKKENSTLLIG